LEGSFVFLVYAGLAVQFSSLTAYLLGRISPRRHYALMMCAWLAWGVRDVHGGQLGGAVVDAVFFTLYAWWWWKNGGGDDTKRRLREFGRAFSPVRRTAPSPA
jgi:Flp pilus assembly protein TadB